LAERSRFSLQDTVMKDKMRDRLRRALEMKRVSLKKASTDAGLGPSFAHEFIKYGRGGSHQALERLCNSNGISWDWVKTGAGEIIRLPAGRPIRQLNQEALEVALLAALHEIFPAVPAIRGLALLIIRTAKVQPGSTLDESMKSTIRSQISGAISLFRLQSNQLGENL
jgi:hypothetical protein